MKKYLAFVLSAALIFGLAACGGETGKFVSVPKNSETAAVSRMEEIKYDLIPMVMVDGEIYLDTGRESKITARCGVMDGEITSFVDSSERPSKDSQSNFGSGYGYQRLDENHIDVCINGKWMTFVKEGYTEPEAETVAVSRFGEERSVALSAEDSAAVLAVLDGITNWEDVTADCLNDCVIEFRGAKISYHSDCGTFNDGANESSFTVTESEREMLNAVLEKYIALGFEP